MHSRRPEGYESNYAALLDLIRFGFGIWTPAQMAVLLFHAERSTIYGRQADQHSQAQAITGIYSRKNEKWIRGPAGIGISTWKRANAELATSGAIRRVRRTNHNGTNTASEYAIDWLAIRAAIHRFQEKSDSASGFPLAHIGPQWANNSKYE